LNDEQLGWQGTINGQELSPGVYVFVAEVEYLDSEIVVYEGDITLLR